MRYVHQMKGAHHALDPRLGRVPQPDPRNSLYPIFELRRAKDTARRLRSYSWMRHNREPHMDQGQEGSCVGFGFAHELIARPFVRPVTPSDARTVYFEAQKIDPWDGGAYPGAQPFYEGTSVLAGAKILTRMGDYAQYLWASNEEDIAWAVGHRGPVVIGVNWHEQMMDPDPDGFIRPRGEIYGGHCTVLAGLALKRNAYLVWNSWGASWGANGTAWLSRPDMASLLSDEGEACLPLRQKVVRQKWLG